MEVVVTRVVRAVLLEPLSLRHWRLPELIVVEKVVSSVIVASCVLGLVVPDLGLALLGLLSSELDRVVVILLILVLLEVVVFAFVLEGHSLARPSDGLLVVFFRALRARPEDIGLALVFLTI